MNTVYEPSV